MVDTIRLYPPAAERSDRTLTASTTQRTVKRCLIECGVRQASEEGALAMNVSDPGKNVNLRIDSISRSMVGNIPDLLIDLLEIAAYVYCVDQRIKGGTQSLIQN
jgi:hypothetical protein